MEYRSRKSPLMTLSGPPLSEEAIEAIKSYRQARIAAMSETELAAQESLEKLRASHGIIFNAQQAMVISPEITYYVDFWLPLSRLIIEIDGPEHRYASNNVKDKWRWKLIQQKKVKLVRFTNAEVRTDAAKFRERIVKLCLRTGHPDGRKLINRAIARHKTLA